MLLHAATLSAEKKVAAELLLGYPLSERKAISAQAFEVPAPSAEWKREVAYQMQEFFAGVNENLDKVPPEEWNEVFQEAMRTSRPGFRAHP